MVNLFLSQIPKRVVDKRYQYDGIFGIITTKF